MAVIILVVGLAVQTYIASFNAFGVNEFTLCGFDIVHVGADAQTQ